MEILQVVETNSLQLVKISEKMKIFLLENKYFRQCKQIKNSEKY